MRTTYCRFGFAYFITVASCLTPATQGQVGLQFLGHLPEGFETVTTGISGDGSAVVGYSHVGGLGIQDRVAFRWTADDGMAALGGEYGSEAHAVSANGSVIVGTIITPSGNEAFRWTESGGRVGLGYVTGYTYESNANAVSGDGSTVLGNSIMLGGGRVNYRWTEGSGMEVINSSTNPAPATNISGDGSIIVGSVPGTQGRDAAYMDSSGNVTILGKLPIEVFSNAESTAASFDGSTIVGRQQTTSMNRIEAFRWTESTGMVGLGDLGGGLFSSAAKGVSGDGSLVVGSGHRDDPSSPASQQVAVLWDGEGNVYDLNNLLADLVDLQGQTLTDAVGISYDGNAIAGIAGTGASRTPFLLTGVSDYLATVPEPRTYALVAGLAVMIAAVCRRRR